MIVEHPTPLHAPHLPAEPPTSRACRVLPFAAPPLTRARGRSRRLAEAVGAKVRALRHRRGMSQVQLAQRAGVGEKTLWRLEAGRTRAPHPETLAAVAGALRVEPAELLDAGNEASPGRLPARPALHQLPEPPRNFVGRAREIAALCAAFDPPRLVAIQGMPGVGKTALALKIAEQWAARYRDGQFHLDLRGSRERLASTDAMLHVLCSIDPMRLSPRTEAEVEAAYRSVLRGKRVLLSMDDAADRNQVRALVPPAGSALLVTSRRRLAVPGMHSIDLEPLDDADAATLIRSLAPRVGHGGARLAEPCDGLPRALALVGRTLAERPDLDVDEFASRLADERARLPELDRTDYDRGVQASFQQSYDMLGPAARRGLCLLSIFPHAFDRAAAAAVWAISDAEADARIGELVCLHWLLHSGTGARTRYRLHGLARLFVAARL